MTSMASAAALLIIMIINDIYLTKRFNKIERYLEILVHTQTKGNIY